MKKFIALLAFLLLFTVPIYSAIESYDVNQSGYYNLYTLLIGNDLPELFTSAAEVTAARDGEASLLAKQNAQDASIAALLVGSGSAVSSNDTTPGYLNGKLVAGEGVDLTEGSDGGNETLTVSGEDATVTNKGIASFPDAQFSVSSGAVSIDQATDTVLGAVYLLDEDAMTSNDSTKAASQQSIKAYADTKLASVSEDTTPQAGGEWDFQAHSAGFTSQTATGDGTTTIDWKLGNIFVFTFASGTNETFTFTAPTKDGSFTLVLINDADGGQTATWPSIYWVNGTTPTLSTAATARDIITLKRIGGVWYGMGANGFATP